MFIYFKFDILFKKVLPYLLIKQSPKYRKWYEHVGNILQCLHFLYKLFSIPSYSIIQHFW